MNTPTHAEVIRYLRQLGSELSRRAADMSDIADPMAAHFDKLAMDGNESIERTVDLLIAREDEDRAEFEASGPAGPDRSDREVFNTP
jgi:hypothetical protein